MGNFLEKTVGLVTMVNQRLLEITSQPGPKTLYEPIHYISESGGKRLRALLLLLSCELCGGDLRQCLDAAVAIELLHNFTLVHDDIMDQDDSRRGRATVHVKWDESTAILAGDGLVALAFQTLLGCQSRQIQDIGAAFSTAIVKICEGQALDKEFETRNDVTVSEYFDMIDKKTGRLFAVSCEIGAKMANGSIQQAKDLRSFGAALGRAFQLQDDLLDITVAEAILGKPYGSDVYQRKKTYLFLHAIENPGFSDKLKAIYLKDTIEPSDITIVQKIFEQCGTIENTRLLIENEMTKALKCLEYFIASEAKTTLHSLVQTIATRQA